MLLVSFINDSCLVSNPSLSLTVLHMSVGGSGGCNCHFCTSPDSQLIENGNKEPDAGQNKVLSFITGKSRLENVVRMLVLHSSEHEVKAPHRSRRTEERISFQCSESWHLSQPQSLQVETLGRELGRHVLNLLTWTLPSTSVLEMAPDLCSHWRRQTTTKWDWFGCFKPGLHIWLAVLTRTNYLIFGISSVVVVNINKKITRMPNIWSIVSI